MKKIHLGTITRISSNDNITHKKLFATQKELLKVKKALGKKYESEIKREIKDPKSRDLLLKLYRLTSYQRARTKLFKQKRQEHIKKLENKKWKKLQEWEKRREEKCYKRFLKEFHFTEAKLKKIIGEENFKNFKALKKFYFFTYLFYEPLFLVGEGTKEESLALNPKYGKERDFEKEREMILTRGFNKIIELEAKKYAALYNLDWQDLYQEFEIKLMKERGKYDPNKTASLLTYYKKIIRNRAIDLAKKEPKLFLSLESIKQEQYKESVSIIDVNKEDREDLRLAMDKLTPKQREAIELIYFEGKTLKEAAKYLGISVDSFKDRYTGAIKKLRKLLLQ